MVQSVFCTGPPPDGFDFALFDANVPGGTTWLWSSISEINTFNGIGWSPSPNGNVSQNAGDNQSGTISYDMEWFIFNGRPSSWQFVIDIDVFLFRDGSGQGSIGQDTGLVTVGSGDTKEGKITVSRPLTNMDRFQFRVSTQGLGGGSRIEGLFTGSWQLSG